MLDADPAGLATIMGSTIRGAVLHKIIEEILTGEIQVTCHRTFIR